MSADATMLYETLYSLPCFLRLPNSSLGPIGKQCQLSPTRSRLALVNTLKPVAR